MTDEEIIEKALKLIQERPSTIHTMSPYGVYQIHNVYYDEAFGIVFDANPIYINGH